MFGHEERATEDIAVNSMLSSSCDFLQEKSNHRVIPTGYDSDPFFMFFFSAMPEIPLRVKYITKNLA